MQDIITTILLGALGGVVRALVGIAKYFKKNTAEKKIRVGYLAFSLFVAALVGAVSGVLTNGDWRLALIVGYAGTDFLEGLYKIKQKQGFEI